MKSRAAIAGHPLHPIFVIIPIGLWSFSPVCDLVYHVGWGNETWKFAAFYCLAGGTIATVPAFITGLMDYGLCQDPGAAQTVKYHLICNIIVTLLMIASIVIRLKQGIFFTLLPVWISFGGVMLAGISGWLGGELVSRFGISVHESALQRGAVERTEVRRVP